MKVATRLTASLLLFVGLLVALPAVAFQINSELAIFESARDLELSPKGTNYEREFGWKVVERDGSGRVLKAKLDLLVDNIGYEGQIFVIGPFNEWGKKLRFMDGLRPLPGKPHIFSATITGLQHGMPYRILLNGKQVLDPTSMMFTTREYLEREGQLSSGAYLNSVFYDLRDPKLYQSKTDFVDVTSRPNLIGEVELHSLVAKFRAHNGQLGPRTTADTYRFIAESGVVGRLKEAGYSAIEMLPFNQSIDGDSWHLRYQVFGLFAPDSRYGNPSEFKMMIDEFHRNGLAVVMDSVISHFPYKGNSGDRSLAGIGLDQWFKADGRALFVGPLSPWDTYRYDYANPFLRRYLIDSVKFMMSEYKIDGVRMDNTDGILGTAGGQELLRELTQAVREINPRALMIAEAFFTPASLLHRSDKGGYGFNTRNDSNFFEIWRNNLLGPTESLDLNQFSALLKNIFAWNEVPMMRYLTTHDESANGRGGFSGAYPASLISGDSYYAFSKTKAADALNMLASAYHVSLPQARMMQTGTFYTNPAVDWQMMESGRGKNLWDFFAALSRYMQHRSSHFNFASLARDIENHVDNESKIISLRRRDPSSGKEIYILLNLGHQRIENYRFGIGRQGSFRLSFDSEWSGFGGNQELQTRLGGNLLNSSHHSEHGKSQSLSVPVVAPYSVSIFEEQ